MTDRDTVPAPPVPSTNPTADMRKGLEANVREKSVAIMRSGWGLWRGVTIEDHVVTAYTIELDDDEAHQWLRAAKNAARAGAWIPTVCPRCAHPRDTPDLCSKCLRDER